MIGVSTAGNFSILGASKWSAPVNANFPSPFSLNTVATTFWTFFQNDVPDGNNIIAEYKVGVTDTNTPIGTNAALVGHWVHWCYTFNQGTGAQHLYALLEGFSPNSPSFLTSTNIGVSTIGLPTNVNAFDDAPGGGDHFPGGLNARMVLTPQELTQAQALAQFSQRAPTGVITGGGAYTLLACTSAANVQLDAGTTASNFTKSGTFTDSSDQPLEWNPGLYFGSGTTQ